MRRIDHGVRSVEDEALLVELAASRVPLTVCPLSNLRLCVYESMEQHRILELLERGLCVTVNSDDPAYFGGDLLENFDALEHALGLNQEQGLQLVRNGFEAAYLSAEDRAALLSRLDDYLVAYPGR